MKKLPIIITIIVIFGLPKITVSSTTTLEDCESATVVSALDAASSGDIIVCPADEVTWEADVTVPNGVTLRGNGIGSTVVNSESFITTRLNDSSRLTGFEFTNGVAKSTCGQNWIIDYCKFTAESYDSGGISIGGVTCSSHPTGVFYKCTFEHIRFVMNGTGLSSDWYARYPPIGSTQYVVYWDGCIFNSAGDYTNGVDSNYGGAKVIRFCTINDTPMGSHGGRASGARGTVRHSMYRNTWTHAVLATSSYAWWIRGGSGMVFDNNCIGAESNCDYAIDFERAYEEEKIICAADTGYETVPHPSGGDPNYMCRDGVGVGKDLGANPDTPGTYNHGQESSPYYIWNQTLNSGASNVGFSNNSADFLVENRDYFFDSVLGSGGVTSGLYANIPTCDATKTKHGYWATDGGGDWNSSQEWAGADGALYVCDGAGTWSLYFTPPPYPHSLIGRLSTKGINIGSGTSTFIPGVGSHTFTPN